MARTGNRRRRYQEQLSQEPEPETSMGPPRAALSLSARPAVLDGCAASHTCAGRDAKEQEGFRGGMRYAGPRLLSPGRSAMPLPSPAAVGMALTDVDTPALLIDLDAFERNLRRMADFARGAGVRLRPHSKTHKSPIIAARQVDRKSTRLNSSHLGISY